MRTGINERSKRTDKVLTRSFQNLETRVTVRFETEMRTKEYPNLTIN